MDFKITAWAQGLERGAEDIEVRAKAGGEGAAVDVIERLRVEPRVLAIVDFEG